MNAYCLTRGFATKRLRGYDESMMRAGSPIPLRARCSETTITNLIDI